LRQTEVLVLFSTSRWSACQYSSFYLMRIVILILRGHGEWQIKIATFDALTRQIVLVGARVASAVFRRVARDDTEGVHHQAGGPSFSGNFAGSFDYRIRSSSLSDVGLALRRD
jgi:hypothetical protein